ncbi:diacylglycerol kinase family protein [Rhodococcus aerolatus]
MRALLIVNPNATSTTAAGRDVLARALTSGVRLRVAHTDHRGHAAELARGAVDDGLDLVVVHGGDGTVNEAVNGMLGAPGSSPGPLPALGVLPGGSANVFARSLGISPEPMAAARQLLAAVDSGARRRTGLGVADDRWFLFNAGLGWDAEVVASVDRHRRHGGDASPARYVRAAVAGYVRARRHRLALHATLDGPDGREEVGALRSLFVSATDPWTYLGPRAVHTNPDTRPDRGLGVFALRSMGLATVARVVPAMLRAGGQPRSAALLRRDDVDRVEVRCGSEVDLQLDGEHLGTRTAVTFARAPEALEVALEPPRPTG